MKRSFTLLLLAMAFLLSVTFAQSLFSDLPLFSEELTEEGRKELLEVARKWKEERKEETAAPLNPVILIPGLTGSNLNVKLSSAKSPLLCSKNADWELLWLKVPALSFPDCFFYNLGQKYDPITKAYSNNVGVDIDPVDFGGVSGVEYIGYVLGGPVQSMEYMEPLIASLQAAGYVVGSNLAAAPYDWRQTANPNGWNSRLQSLIETLSANNQNLPVYVLAHSMGNLEFTSFLNTMSSEWKQQYIGGFLSAAGPWSGSSFALRALISGLKIGLIDPLRVAREIRSFGSQPNKGGVEVMWMLPDEYLGSEPLVVVDENTSYNYQTIPDLLTAIGAYTSLEIYNDVGDEVANMPNPNVPIYCIYGTNKETELWYEYGNGLNDQPTVIHYETAGDGVVPLASLQKCSSFNPVETKEFNLLGHSDLIKDPEFFNYIIQIINP